MKRPLRTILPAVLVLFAAALPARAQTEGFNVKTTVQKISDNAAGFLNGIIADAKKDPAESLPKELVCAARCYIVIPSVSQAPGRDDFAGTGLLTCRTAADTGKLTPPLFYQITNVESFGESGGGIVIFVTGKAGVKSVLGDQLQLNAANSGAGKVGESQAEGKSFVAFVNPPGGAIKGFDPAESTLVYASGDTFNAYQQDLDPVDVMLFGIDIPPALRGFAASAGELIKGCK